MDVPEVRVGEEGEPAVHVRKTAVIGLNHLIQVGVAGELARQPVGLAYLQERYLPHLAVVHRVQVMVQGIGRRVRVEEPVRGVYRRDAARRRSCSARSCTAAGAMMMLWTFPRPKSVVDESLRNWAFTSPCAANASWCSGLVGCWAKRGRRRSLFQEARRAEEIQPVPGVRDPHGSASP